MDAEPAIIVNNVSKKFRLFSSKNERIKEALDPFNRQYHRPFWALDGVSFEVDRGTTLGILGRNGSGKSTLLEIIASVMQPTSGSVSVNGRVAALLELGAGFNPEFSGRDNVILNGAIQGFGRAEMESRLPEIEAFADIGEFFDKPVKIYSSGMFVRVAFAAAINIDPEILIVDEALSVGDTKFQHKCYLAFRSFLDAGKTLVLVSHDAATLLRLCNSGVVLEHGKVHYKGAIKDSVNAYQELLFGGRGSEINSVINEKSDESHGKGRVNNVICEPSCSCNDYEINIPLSLNGFEDLCPTRPNYNKNEARLGDGRAVIIDYAVVAENKVNPLIIPSGELTSLFFKIYLKCDLTNISVGFAFVTTEGVYVYGTNLHMQKKPLLSGKKGDILLLRFDVNTVLVGGDYFLNLGCNQIYGSDDVYLDVRRSIAHLRVSDTEWCTGFAALSSRFTEIKRMVSVEQNA